MKAIFVHLSGSKRGKTEFFTSSKINIGTNDSCNLRFEQATDKNISSLHAEIRLERCDYILRDLDSSKGTLVNNRPIKEVIINDGDLVEFGENGPRARFRVKTEEGDICKPFTEMLADSMDLAREPYKGRKLSTALAFFRILLTEAFTQSSLKFKVGIFSIFILIVCGISTLFYTGYSRLTETAKRIEALEFESTIAEKIIKDFSGGVCLIQGSFSLIDENGEPLKSWGNGRLITNDYTGTGFLVSKDGKVLTNRHIAEPWWNKRAYFISIERGLKPKFEELRAFFPNIEKPFPLKIEKVSDDADVALLSLNLKGENVPVLELDQSDSGAVEGEPVILLGYPAGLNAIYAKADPGVAEEIIKLPFTKAAEELSHRNLIRPLATQGHVSDVIENRIVYDAQTTLGGSGGPLFNNKGKIIGINYGIFHGFRGANFGVPVKYALALLEDEKH